MRSKITNNEKIIFIILTLIISADKLPHIANLLYDVASSNGSKKVINSKQYNV